MSHMSKVQVQIRDCDVLENVLKDMHLRCIGEVNEAYEFSETFNQCDVIAVARGNHCLGFRFEEDGAVLHHNLDEYEFQKIQQELLQRYSVRLLKKTVEAEGKFSLLEEEKLPDGTIRLKVGRWV